MFGARPQARTCPLLVYRQPFLCACTACLCFHQSYHMCAICAFDAFDVLRGVAGSKGCFEAVSIESCLTERARRSLAQIARPRTAFTGHSLPMNAVILLSVEVMLTIHRHLPRRLSLRRCFTRSLNKRRAHAHTRVRLDARCSQRVTPYLNGCSLDTRSPSHL